MVLPIDILTAKLIGQMMLIGDVFVLLLTIMKIFGCFIRRFVVMFISLAVCLFVLQRVKWY